MIELYINSGEYELVTENQEFDLEIDPATIVYTGGVPYTGSYEVTPKVAQSVVLETANKVLSKDITVKKIPQFEVSNEANGKTLIIGEEYYGGQTH